MSDKNKKQGLTKTEKKILQYLADAHNYFVTLGDTHPNAYREFSSYINGAQNLIAVRVAARVDPEFWMERE